MTQKLKEKNQQNEFQRTLKTDENNYYGQAMIKPLGCIKKNDLKKNRKISHDDKIGHLFTVDIKFRNKN